jgi:histidine triad (HIT) family protein
MDLRQANPGHVLVIPKQHIPTIYDLPPDIGAVVMQCVIEMSRAVKEAFQAEGLSIWQSNGECAGQEIPHVHFHVHPRKPNDGLLRVYSSKVNHPPSEILQQDAEKIRAYLP